MIGVLPKVNFYGLLAYYMYTHVHAMYVSNTISIKIVDSENRHIIGTENWGCCSDICPREYLGNFLQLIASEIWVGGSS